MSYQPPQGYGPPGYPPPGYPPQGPPPPAPAGLNITVVVVAAIVVAGGVVGAAILTSGRPSAPATPAAAAPVPVAMRPIAAPPEAPGRAEVNCVPGGIGFSCTVRHVSGPRPLMVCWQIVVECQNSARVTGSACQVVQPEGTNTRLIPEASLRNIRQCDTAVATSIENLVITPGD